MTDYYVDPDTGDDANAGTAWGAGNAWATLQKAADTATAGDTTYCKHGTGNDETPSATIDFDTNSGTVNSPIQFIGVNNSGTDDGTKYVIDGGSLPASNDLIQGYNTKNFIYLKNFEIKNGKQYNFGLGSIYPQWWLLENCIISGATSDGVEQYGFKYSTFIKCHFLSNGGDGFKRPFEAAFAFCVFNDNTEDGLENYHDSNTFYGCIFHNNGFTGFKNTSGNQGKALLFNCVLDDNTDGIYNDPGTTNALSIFIGNRLTNNSDYGMEITDNYTTYENWNFLLNNTTGAKSIGSQYGGGDDLTSGTEGYNDRANDDFNLTSSATLRRTSIDLGVGT
jgi:hypothetical protein